MACLNFSLGFLHFGLAVTHFLIVLFHHFAEFAFILFTFFKFLFISSHLANNFRYFSLEISLFGFEFIYLLL